MATAGPPGGGVRRRFRATLRRARRDEDWGLVLDEPCLPLALVAPGSAAEAWNIRSQGEEDLRPGDRLLRIGDSALAPSWWLSLANDDLRLDLLVERGTSPTTAPVPGGGPATETEAEVEAPPLHMEVLRLAENHERMACSSARRAVDEAGRAVLAARRDAEMWRLETAALEERLQRASQPRAEAPAREELRSTRRPLHDELVSIQAIQAERLRSQEQRAEFCRIAESAIQGVTAMRAEIRDSHRDPADGISLADEDYAFLGRTEPEEASPEELCLEVRRLARRLALKAQRLEVLETERPYLVASPRPQKASAFKESLRHLREEALAGAESAEW